MCQNVTWNRKTALERQGLRDLGVTHVLNAAEGKWNNVLTGAEYYSDMDIQYFGVEADDKPTFNMSQYFSAAAQFVHEALSHTHSESHHRANENFRTESCYVLISYCCRQSAGALRDGPEQVSHPGPSVPDDERAPHCGGRHRARATAALYPPQPRVPETAPCSGHRFARGDAQTEKANARAMRCIWTQRSFYLLKTLF